MQRYSYIKLQYNIREDRQFSSTFPLAIFILRITCMLQCYKLKCISTLQNCLFYTLFKGNTIHPSSYFTQVTSTQIHQTTYIRNVCLYHPVRHIRPVHFVDFGSIRLSLNNSAFTKKQGESPRLLSQTSQSVSSEGFLTGLIKNKLLLLIPCQVILGQILYYILRDH